MVCQQCLLPAPGAAVPIRPAVSLTEQRDHCAWRRRSPWQPDKAASGSIVSWQKQGRERLRDATITSIGLTNDIGTQRGIGR